MAAYKAFREPYLVTDLFDEEDFSDFKARQLRYALFWSFFENTAYRDIHNWAKKYRADHGLYKYIRNIYNPAYRLGEFWKTHLMGGSLDPEAGDGEVEPTAIPILTDQETLRPAIARLWHNSNWHINKDVMTLFGPVFGDVGLRIVDDTQREKVYIEVVHPRIIKAVTLDRWRNVKRYELEEERPDPRIADRQRSANRTVVYTEIAERSGDAVVYRTLLDGQPYAWNGIAAEWSEGYGFIPFVLIAHNDVGLTWGWSEMHPIRSKVHEVDDLASMLHDQIRKTVRSGWLIAGVDKPKDDPKTTGAAATTTKPEPGREEVPTLYAQTGATATPLVAPLPIGETAAEIRATLEEIERDYPELQADIWTASGDASGRALRVARQRSESKVRQRRVNYDDGLRRAHQMGVAIGGERGYEGFDGFNLDSYDRGDLDHTIGKRPVFAQDPLDDIELNRAFWEAASVATNAGMPLDEYLRREGWDEDEIARVIEGKQRETAAQLEADTIRRQQDNSAALEVMGRALRRRGVDGQPSGQPGGRPEGGG